MTRGENVADRDQQPQPTELSTRERMGTYLGAAADGVRHEAKGEHETERGTGHAVALPEAERIIESWPNPPKRVAEQMLAKYGAAERGDAHQALLVIGTVRGSGPS
ncbi:MAG: hypothetical protein M3P34_04090 [Actinomycetota bacterium]|nr:hypothetical protein [Actinomycetota bacterium]